MALTDKLTAIGDAIRVQSGKTEKIPLSQMPTEIINLQSLNFEVVGNPKPQNPKENTVWVNTDVAIPNWTLSATEPSSGDEGMVCIRTGKASKFAFNALTKNGLMVYPIVAYQNISGAFKRVSAEIWQAGKWQSLLTDTAFYENGEFNVEVFGDPTGTTNVGGVVMHWVNGYGATATKLFNVAGFDRIEIDVHSAFWAIVDVRFLDESGTVVKSKQVNPETTGGTFSVDISGMTGLYYLEFRCIADGTNWVRISSIKFMV